MAIILPDKLGKSGKVKLNPLKEETSIIYFQRKKNIKHSLTSSDLNIS